MKQLYYVRHGECELNVSQCFAGQKESRLTEKGRDQAQLAATHIHDQQLAIDVIISSPLSRTLDTAKIIATAIDYPVNQIIVNKLFMERSFGMLEGSPRREFFDAYSYEDISLAPGAESMSQLHDRAEKAWSLVQSIHGNNVLIVGHSAFYRAFHRAVCGGGLGTEYVSPFSALKNGQVCSLVTVH